VRSLRKTAGAMINEAVMRRLRPNIVFPALTCAVLSVQAAALCAAEALPSEDRKPSVPELKVEKYKLPNGLTVTLHEDHKTPLVAVNVIYNAGSKDDPPGRTGLAHLVEHMMFEGSQHYDESYYLPIYQYYTEAQGATTKDRTVYHITATSNALELVLWLEADRMGYLVPAMTQAKLDNVRGVVKNERRQNRDDRPFGQVDEVMAETLYPPGHPYRHLGIGSMPDLSAVRIADISQFLKPHYVPNNAFLCVAGDFKPAEARRWIEEYFGPIRAGTLAAPPKANAPSLAQSRQITQTDRVSHTCAHLNWVTVPADHPDEAALDVLAFVLGGGAKASRLYRALIYDRQIAGQIDASHPTYLHSGNFVVNLFARPGRKLDELVRVADAEIDRLKRDGPTADEVRKAQIERERSQMMEFESVTGKASVLNDNTATHGDPLAYQWVLARIFAVTPADVVRVARDYLGARRIEIDVLPGARVPLPSEIESERARPDPPVALEPKPSDKDFAFLVMPEPAPAPRFSPPAFHRRKLSNGLEIHVVERHELPLVSIHLVVKSGETSTPRGKEGLASIAVDSLQDGTKSRTALELESELLGIGAALATDGRLESSIVSLTTMATHLEKALELFADVILNPSFPDEEVRRHQIDRLGLLQARADHPHQIADDVFPRLLYPSDHPYARPRLGTLESVQSIARDDVVAFYRTHFVPGNSALVVVGDVRLDVIASALEARFARWMPGPIPPAPSFPPIPAPAVRPTIDLIDTPGSAQSVLAIGRTGTTVHAPDRYALSLLRDKLGGRINSKLRDEKGYSYGFSTQLELRKDAGPLVATGSVETAATKEALADVLNEVTGLAGERPVTEEEITEIQDGLIPPWFDRFETIAGVAAGVSYLVSEELPDDYYATEQSRMGAVTKADFDRVAKEYLIPERMTILVVGDRSRIEASLRALPSVKSIRLLDTAGRPLADAPAPKPAAAAKSSRH
jgi:zinc protease